MSITVIADQPAVKRSVRGQLTSALLRDYRRMSAEAPADHQAGRHVGVDPDTVACGACLCSGDMPESSAATLSRAEYLERNIAETVRLMRLRADLVAFEHAIAS